MLIEQLQYNLLKLQQVISKLNNHLIEILMQLMERKSIEKKIHFIRKKRINDYNIDDHSQNSVQKIIFQNNLL